MIASDIQHFIRERLAKIPEELSIEAPPGWAGERDVEALAERSGKLFVYANTALLFMADHRVRDPADQLRVILQGDVEKGNNPYAQLDHLYMQVLCDAIGNPERPGIAARIRLVVGTVITIRDPLSVSSLFQFLRSDIKNVDAVGRTLSNLQSIILSGAHPDDVPRVYHQSFPDFITNPKRCNDQMFLIEPAVHHERVAIRCFELMADGLKENIVGLVDPFVPNAEVANLQNRVNDAMAPELQYACRYWHVHLMEANIGGSATSVQRLESFLSTSLMYWIEAMSLLGDISITVSGLEQIHLWAVRVFFHKWILKYAHVDYFIDQGQTS